MPSIGPLSLILTVQDIGWTKGLDKAKRELQRTQREIDTSAKQQFGKDFGADKLGTEIRRIYSGSVESMKNAETSAVRDSFQKTGLSDGQGFAPIGETSKATVNAAAAESTARTNRNLLSAVAVAGSFATALSSSVELLKGHERAVQGIKEGWGNAKDKVSEYVRAIPLVGESIGGAIDFASGRDLRQQSYEKGVSERNALERAGAERARLARDLGRQAADAEAETRIAGAKGLEQNLLQIEQQRKQAQQAINQRFDENAGNRTSPEAIAARNRALASENAKFDEVRAVAIRDYNEQQSLSLRGLEGEATAMQLRIGHRQEEAQLVQTQAEYAIRIAQAEQVHNDALARQLGINRDLAIEELKRQDAEKKNTALRNADADLVSTGLRLTGREEEARYFEIAKQYEDQIDEARKQGNGTLADRLELTKKLKLEEAARQGGIFQGDALLTARGPSVSGGLKLSASDNSRIGYISANLKYASRDRQTELLEMIAEVLQANAPGRLR